MLRFAALSLLTLAIGATTMLTHAQDSDRAPEDTSSAWHEDAWTPIVTKGGVEFTYLFYSKADNENNGVVIRLRNENETAVRYAFTIIFRGPAGKATAHADGDLGPGETKTGEQDGLFWIPFKDGRRIGEVGLRGIDVTPLPADGSESSSRG